MIKFGRNYTIIIFNEDGSQLTIEPPFTLELDLTRKTLGSCNICQLRIYNLAKATRDLIRFNAYNQTNFKQIIVQAGYGTKNLPTIFSGNIQRAWSVREGVNYITQIECYDGGFASVNANVEISFPAGTPIQIVINTLMQNIPHVTVGAVGAFQGILSRGNTFSGNPIQLLFELTGGAFFIDNGKAYALKTPEYIADIPVLHVDSSTGLLNTPVVEETTARFEMIFEPSMFLGSLALVNSETFPQLNGLYKINGVKHKGIISEVVSGDLITTGEFFYSETLTPVISVS